MINIEKYTENKNYHFIKYSYNNLEGEPATHQFASRTKKGAMLRYADNCRHYIIAIIESNGINTTGLHNLEISTFLSRVYWIENSIRKQVVNSKDVFQACRQIKQVINLLTQHT